MLGMDAALATVAVRDLPAARRFYEGTLGLTPTHTEDSEAVAYGTAGAEIIVYRSSFAGTNKATAVTWIAGNEVESTVQTLRVKGVVFEHYDMPGSTRKGDVHVMGDMKAAWFKDPDGNIHAIVSR